VSIGKSVPNLISYLHEFFQNFYQSLAIRFELFSFEEFVYSKIADSGPTCQTPRAAPGPRGSVPLLCGHHAPRRRHGLKPLSGQRIARPESCVASPAPRPTAASRRSPLTVASPAPPASRPPRACLRRPDRHGLKPPTPGPTPSRATRPSSSRRAAVSRAPMPSHCRLTKQRRHRAACRRAVPRALTPWDARCAGQLSWAASAAHGPRMLRQPRPWAAPAPRTVHLGRA
jgi:hypothetical protein